MQNHDASTEIRIARFLSGNASEIEKSELNNWIEASDRNRDIFRNFKQAWDRSIYLSACQIESDKSKLSGAYNSYLSTRWINTRKKLRIMQLAAAVVIPLAIVLLWNLLSLPTTAPLAQIQQIIAPEGDRTQTILPDGTRIWLNSGTTMGYDALQFNLHSRVVSLNGEAYFEVANNAGLPFKVVTDHTDVVVTGTAFNVKALPESPIFELILAEGSLTLFFKSDNSEQLDMVPNQQLIYNAETQKKVLNQVDAEMLTTWRTGELIFRDATLRELITALENIHAIQFNLEQESLGNYRFRGMIRIDNNLIEVLDKIEKTSGIGYVIENQTVLLRKHN